MTPRMIFIHYMDPFENRTKTSAKIPEKMGICSTLRFGNSCCNTLLRPLRINESARSSAKRATSFVYFTDRYCSLEWNTVMKFRNMAFTEQRQLDHIDWYLFLILSNWQRRSWGLLILGGTSDHPT